MIKRLVLAVGLVLGLCAISQATELKLSEQLAKLPALKQGVAWSIADSKLNYLSTLELAKWKGFNLECGYAGRAENTGDKIVSVLSYDLLKLKDLGVTLPILDLLEANLGIYAGYGRIENLNSLDDSEFDYGVSLTLIKVKW